MSRVAMDTRNTIGLRLARPRGRVLAGYIPGETSDTIGLRLIRQHGATMSGFLGASSPSESQSQLINDAVNAGQDESMVETLIALGATNQNLADLANGAIDSETLMNELTGALNSSGAVIAPGGLPTPIVPASQSQALPSAQFPNPTGSSGAAVSANLPIGTILTATFELSTGLAGMLLTDASVMQQMAATLAPLGISVLSSNTTEPNVLTGELLGAKVDTMSLQITLPNYANTGAVLTALQNAAQKAGASLVSPSVGIASMGAGAVGVTPGVTAASSITPATGESFTTWFEENAGSIAGLLIVLALGTVLVRKI